MLLFCQVPVLPSACFAKSLFCCVLMLTLKRANLSRDAAGQQHRFGTSTDYTLKNDHPADKQQGRKPCPAPHFQ
jgi:hypothetical protein